MQDPIQMAILQAREASLACLTGLWGNLLASLTDFPLEIGAWCD